MNTLKTALLLGLLSGLLIVAGGALGGRGGIAIAFGLAVVMNVGSYWFSDKIVLRMYKAAEVGPDHPLHRLTARLVQKAQLPMPKVYVIPDMSPNAFATGRNPQHAAVAATEGILRLLSDAEIEGVIAHELAHVKNRDILTATVAATIGAAITSLAHMAQFAALFGGGSRDGERGGQHPLVMLVMIILAPLAAMLIQMAISRQREFAADRTGAEIAGTPMGLAQALRRIEAASRQVPLEASPATAHLFIVAPFIGEGLGNLFRSHPPTEARVQALLALRGGRL
jgi:heat shock protein HtpX